MERRTTLSVLSQATLNSKLGPSRVSIADNQPPMKPLPRMSMAPTATSRKSSIMPSNSRASIMPRYEKGDVEYDMIHYLGILAVLHLVEALQLNQILVISMIRISLVRVFVFFLTTSPSIIIPNQYLRRSSPAPLQKISITLYSSSSYKSIPTSNCLGNSKMKSL